MAESFWEDWWDFLQNNYVWFLPMVATLMAPLIGAGANALWDYLKMKKLV